MSRLEIRLLGGFEARLGDTAIRGFESQKARAVFAYLALHRDQPTSRERLAGLLWADRPDEVARRNLRQALHNVKSALGQEAGADSVFRADHTVVELDPDLPCWIDVEAFERAAADGISEAGPNPHHLTEAARLYVGDLLSGFIVRGSPDFEEWMLAEQERLREEAIIVFHTLIKSYLQRGEHRLGIQYARRLLSIDPLSEEANRHLMRLHWQAGQRSRALAQYEQLRNLLERELDVEPLHETQSLYLKILEEELPKQPEEEESEPSGPLIPMVGRSEPLGRLQEIWGRILDGGSEATVVEGEGGVGKTRLIKAFVDSATSKRHAIVLAGSCYPEAPRVALQPVREILIGAFTDLLPDEPERVADLDGKALADLIRVAPEIADLAGELEGAPAPTRANKKRIGRSVARLLENLAEADGPRPTPLILLIDDLHLADRATLDLFAELARAFRDRPFWLLATAREPAAGASRPFDDQDVGVELERIPLSRLERDDVDEIAHSFAELSSVAELSPFLWRESGGLPLAIAELINFLWDERALLSEATGRWRLDLDRLAEIRPPNQLDRLIHLRVARLPASARRLLAQAAVIGHRFDIGTLARSADEMPAVVDACVERMLQRWLIRQYPLSWSRAGRRDDLVLWEIGVRRGWFEFAHKAIRDATLDHINPLRRRLMHESYAAALAEREATDLGMICERLAHHLSAAGDWVGAVAPLEQAAARSARCGADDVAAWYRQRAETAKERAENQRKGSAEVESLDRRRGRRS